MNTELEKITAVLESRLDVVTDYDWQGNVNGFIISVTEDDEFRCQEVLDWRAKEGEQQEWLRKELAIIAEKILKALTP